MKRAILTLLTASAAFSQPAEAPPKFEAADVHVSAPSLNTVLRITPPSSGALPDEASQHRGPDSHRLRLSA